MPCFSVRQQCVPAHRYAQFSATSASIKTGSYAIGAASAGLLSASLTARELLLLLLLVTAPPSSSSPSCRCVRPAPSKRARTG
jgi:hypothetical protein